ncbi:phage minor capsid protein [Aneurinibacillus aneurinilyticus]|uniref:phage minor capsid protein n=1 Tax=Aneurinibacillus aneurinilyticus TaxID=1391 RepID=UPI0023F1E486|nr:phage minor capsid protein [Aneurinibacillus aneurinilyticus]
MKQRDIPEPNYEYDIQRLVTLYKRGIFDILAELNRLDLTDMQRAQILATLKNVAEILRSINEESAKWVDEVIPKVITDGIASTIVALGVVETAEEAQKIIKFNKANKALTEAVISDTQTDLLAVTQNIERRVRTTIRQVSAESLRANYAKGINGRKAISRDILTGLREQLGKSVDTGIIDAAGRRWKPEVYVDMLVRTKTTSAHMDATINEALSREAYYGRISKHGATDACRNYEGKIVKLVPDAPGPYEYIGSLRGGRLIFHPNCKHLVTPTRIPNGI